MSAAPKPQSLAGDVRVTYAGDPVVAAGSLIRFAVTFAAAEALPTGTEVALARRWPSDWGIPQSSDPSKPDYLRVTAGRGRAVRWWNARMHLWHPFDHVMFVALTDGLAAGESLRIEFGGRDDESPGFTAQTFIEEGSPLSIRLRARPHDEWRELARPTVQIAGAAAHRLVLTAPSRVAAGHPFSMHLRVEDKWGNPSRLEQPVRVDGVDVPVRIPHTGWTRFEMKLSAPGVHRIGARVDGDEDFATTTSNPVEVVDGESTDMADSLYWGDLHAQSVIGCGARTIDAYFRHARDFAGTDFSSHQANCFLVSNDEWTETATSTSRIHEDGRFVTLLGVEWSAASAYGGDHNLYFPGDRAELHRCSHEFIADKSDSDTDLKHIDDLHAHYRGSDTIVALHVGGRTADLRWHDPSLDRLIEVHSTHATSEWFLFDALKRGYRMGVIAGSDGVDGRPGASHPGHMGVRNLRGGLTAVTMPALTRGSLWSALRARHCYGTTGARILLDVRAGDARMGDEVRVERLPAFVVRVEGTAPLETVDFFRDDVLVQSVDVMGSADPALSNQLRIAWCGATAPGNWQRARMVWDGLFKIEGARILDAQPWALDTPDERISGFDAHHVRFKTITAGDWDGIVATLDGFSEDARLTFVTEPMSLQTPLSGLGAASRVFNAENPARRLELRRLPSAMPSPGWKGTFTDTASPPGPHAWWIRVRQSDGEYAWSTPIFITLEPRG